MQKKTFQRTVLGFFEREGRDFPWRRTYDPYEILVSEIMLQQTQTDRVVPKYLDFLSRFPTVEALAAANTLEVLKLWQGLGYNRRARALLELARTVVNEHGGAIPGDESSLRALPGIGSYTARAVLVFAHRMPLPLIETNIRAVYLHHFFAERESVHDREVMPLIEQTIHRPDPRAWFYALMDYGSSLKRTIPGIGRRSAHYAKQSPFKGSNREVRGALLRALATEPNRTAAQLVSSTELERDRILRSLGELVKEGFLKKNGARYSIA